MRTSRSLNAGTVTAACICIPIPDRDPSRRAAIPLGALGRLLPQAGGGPGCRPAGWEAEGSSLHKRVGLHPRYRDATAARTSTPPAASRFLPFPFRPRRAALFHASIFPIGPPGLRSCAQLYFSPRCCWLFNPNPPHFINALLHAHASSSPLAPPPLLRSLLCHLFLPPPPHLVCRVHHRVGTCMNCPPSFRLHYGPPLVHARLTPVASGTGNIRLSPASINRPSQEA